MVEREGEPAYLQVCFAAIDRLKKLLHLEELTRPKPAAEDPGDLPTVRDAMAEALAADAAYVPDDEPTPEGEPPPSPSGAPTGDTPA